MTDKIKSWRSRRYLVMDETAESLPEEDVEQAKDVPEPPKMVSLRTLFFRFADKTDKILILMGTIAAVVAGCSGPIISILTGDVMDTLNDPDPAVIVSTISTLCVEIVILAAVAFAAFWVQTTCWMIQAERQAQRIRLNCLKSILRQEMSWFDDHRPGELVSRITHDVRDVQDGMNDKVGQLLQCFVTFFAGFIIAFIKGWHLALVISATIPIMAAAAIYNANVNTRATRRGQDAYARAGEVADEVLVGIRTVAAFGGEEKESARYRENLKVAMKAGQAKGVASGLATGITMIAQFFSLGLSLFFGAWLVMQRVPNPFTGEAYSGGDVVSIFWCLFFGCFALGQAGPLIPAIITARTTAVPLFELCERKSQIDVFSDEGEIIPDLKGKIEFQNVNFSYPSRPDLTILRGVSFTVEAGTTVALVGQSGSGKSTTCGLLMRFYDPAAGAVLLDGRDLRTLNVRWLRESVGIVSQEPVLFGTSIKENIRFGKPDATDDEIIEACKASNAHDFISKLSKGYDTYVGEGGSQLSGGQKQRIAIARALVKNPKILILDEATSALDNESERVVQEALERLMRGRTVLVIAHRLSTIQNAACIYVFKSGAIVERGNHADLLDKKGLYHSMVQSQSSQAGEETDRTNRAAGAASQDEIVADAPVINDMNGKKEGFFKRKLSGRKSMKREVTNTTTATETESTAEAAKPLSAQYGRMIRILRPVWWLGIIGTIGALLNGAVFPFFSLLYAHILNVFYPESGMFTPEQLFQAAFWCALMAGLGVYCFAGNVLQIGCFGYVGQTLTYNLRDLSFKAMLRQNMAFFDEEKNNARTLVTQLQSDAAMVEAVSTLKLGISCQTFSVIVTGVIIAMVAYWKLALVAISVAPLVAMSGLLQIKFNAAFVLTSRDSYNAAGQWAGQAVANVRTVASFTSEEKILKNYETLVEGHVRSGKKFAQVSGAGSGAAQFIMYCSFALTFWYGSVLMIAGEIDFQEIIQIVYAILWTSVTLGYVLAYLPDIEKAKYAAMNIFALIDSKSSIDPSSPEGERYDFVEAAVEFRNVRFYYPNRVENVVLNDFNLVVPAGKTVALVGPSGCGKSTTVALIQRLYDPVSGSVLIDGRPVKSLNVRYMRQQMAIVSQEPILFADSVFENIRYGNPAATLDEVIKAAKMSNIHDFIMTLPQQYDTFVGNRGSQLSGGQKQLIAIARAALRNPRILLLDEATSALDANSERVVQDALEKASRGRTTIVIAQKLSTIRDADLIAYVSHGRVEELGTHTELMKQNGQYAALVCQGFLHSSSSQSDVKEAKK